MTILHAIQSAAIDTVEASGMHWRVRKVCSADLARVGFAALAMASASEGGAEEMTPEQVMSKVNGKQMEQLAALQDATVAAGITGVSEDGLEWEPLSIVLDLKREDADSGVLCVSSLPAGVVASCFTKIMELSTDGGKAAERLAMFRTGTDNAPGDLDAGDQDRPLASRSVGA